MGNSQSGSQQPNESPLSKNMLDKPAADTDSKNNLSTNLWDQLACCDSRHVTDVTGRMNSLAGCNGRSGEARKLDEKLMLYCTIGEKDQIKEMLLQGADVKYTRAEGKTCMHLAAHSGHKEAVETLYQSHGDADAVDRDGRTPLHIAALNGHTAVVRYLLEKAEASPNVLDKNDQTALHFACIGGHYQCCWSLIDTFAYVEVDTPSNLQPLHFAALSGHTAICKLLLENNANVDVLCAEDLQSPLHCAASRGHVEVVALLIATGAEVDIRNSSNATPLHHAAMNNHVKVVEKLLEGHANPLAIAKNNWTPMLMAFRQGHMDCGRLLERSASLMKRRARSSTML